MFQAFMLIFSFCCVALLYARIALELFVNRQLAIVNRELPFIHVSRFTFHDFIPHHSQLTNHL